MRKPKGETGGVTVERLPVVVPATEIVVRLTPSASRELEESLTAMPFVQVNHPVLWDVWNQITQINGRAE